MTNRIVYSSSPLRISFIGGGTDLPVFYEKYGGKVLSSCISKRAFCIIKPRDDHKVKISMFDINEQVSFNHFDEITTKEINNIVIAAISKFKISSGFELTLRSDALPGSGLGGSAAATTSVLNALSVFTGHRYQFPTDLAEDAVDIERNLLSIPGGKQDQYACVSGGCNVFNFKSDKITENKLSFNIEKQVLLRSFALLFNSNVVRTDLEIVKNLSSSLKDDRKSRNYLLDILSIVDEAIDAFNSNNFKKFGGLLYEGYKLKKQSNKLIEEGTAVDEFLNACMSFGAYGGKLLGAGGGGYTLIIAPPETHGKITNTARKLGFTPSSFTFAETGAHAFWHEN